MAARSLAVAVAVAADGVAGEPPASFHPVAAFGAAMEWIESLSWRNSKAAGTFYAFMGTAGGFATGKALESAFIGIAGGRATRRPLYSASERAGCRSFGKEAATAIATYVALAGRSLGETAMEISAVLDSGDLDGARRLLPSLVGRDPASLDEKGIASAVVESVAENTVDAVIAPLFWAMIAGAPGVLAYRCVNTMDSMVGHKTARYSNFGWAAARLDDAAAYIPARWTAWLVGRVRRGVRKEIRDVIRNQAWRHPSPNAGVAEGAFAAALGLRLGGTTVYPEYVDERPVLGRGRSPGIHDVARAVELSVDVSGAAVCLCMAVGAMIERIRAGA